MKRLNRNPMRIEAWERRQAAMHEAGHIVICQLFTDCSWGAIWRVDDPAENERTWTGTSTLPDWLSFDQHRMVAVAGAVAEAAWDDPDDWSAWDYALEFPDDASLGDMRPFVDADDPEAAIEIAMDKVWELLQPGGELWPSLLEEARWLIDTAKAYYSGTLPEGRRRAVEQLTRSYGTGRLASPT